MPNETDSIPRVSARDLFMALKLLDHDQETALENIRLRLCIDREVKRRGDFLGPTARDTAVELQKLGLAEGGPYPKSGREYPEYRNTIVRITQSGQALFEVFRCDRAQAYDQLFTKLFSAHAYLREFSRVLSTRPLVAPMLTGLKDHVSERYASATSLADDIAKGTFSTNALFDSLTRRLGRDLSTTEATEIKEGIDRMVTESRLSAQNDEPADFSKKILQRMNTIIIPALFRSLGLDFDYKTHQTLWSLGEEFLVWYATTSHPDYDATLIFPTATLKVASSGNTLEAIGFAGSLAADLSKDFLPRLYTTYMRIQKRNAPIVSAWELRAAFCFENCCQPVTFNRLFEQQYAGADGYELHMEIQRQLPRHELPLRAGQRNIGSLRVLKK